MNNHQLLVGWHRGVVTPREPVPLSGMGKNMARMATYNVVDELMASMTVFADKTGLQNAVLFCCLDWLLIQKDITENAAAAISSATGIPKDRIFFCCSHTHCGPDTGSSHRCMRRYLAWFYGAIARNAKAAVADLQLATVYAGAVQTEKLNFTRRYILKTEEGIRGESSVWGKFTKEEILDYETPADNQLQVVRICRQHGKDIILLNFQVHPGFNGSFKFGNASADMVAGIRYALETKYPEAVVTFFQGAAGNQSRGSRKEEKPALDREQYGEKLIDYAMEALKNGKQLQTAAPKAVHRVTHVTCKTGEQAMMDLNAVSVGELSFVTAPYEMFCNSGMDIKEHGKKYFSITFVCSVSNGYNKYIPVKRSFDLDPEMRSFEVKSCLFIPGTAESLVENYKEMLTELT